MKTKKLKKIIATLLAMFTLVILSNAQTTSLIWQKHYTGNSLNDYAADVHNGGDLRIYVCGTKGTNSGDALTISYNTAGTINTGWPKTYNGSSNGADYATAVTSYGSGTTTAIYVAGSATMTGNSQDALLIKYTQSGTQSWVVTWENPVAGVQQDIANCVKCDGSGNVYICGRTSSLGGDMFVAKYNSSGTVQWGPIVYNSSASNDDSPQFMEINGSYLYITSVRSISGTNHDAVLQKIDMSNGNISWTAVYDGGITSDIDETYWLDFDNAGNIYTVGTTQTSTSANSQDALILKYNSSGTPQCTTTWNSSNNYDDMLASIDIYYPVDAPMVYVTGYTEVNPTNNDADYLTMKFDGTACTSPVWTITLDGSGTGCPTANDDYGYMIMVSGPTAKIYVTGRTFETNQSLNATTVCYTDNGSTASEDYRHSYDRNSTDNGPGNSNTKYPLELGWDGCHGWDVIYVTGYTCETSVAPWDATTLQYAATGNCTEGSEGRMMGGTNLQAEAIIYPNPFAEKATFKFGTGETVYADAEFIVYDIMGKEVKRIEDINTYEFEIDMTDFDNGFYFYKFVQAETILATGKFIIKN
ncbi:MAG TPA: T9SS type A sorting domain-containing protein [Chitinophagaceae bacterium]|nr:T9SS type A sorting domain-containing protein [Chitinophagaceae bacterium]